MMMTVLCKTICVVMIILCSHSSFKGAEARRHWQFPKFNINVDDHKQEVDDNEKLSALWYEQAVTSLMAVVGTRLQNQLSHESPISMQLEKCASKAESSVQYAQCLAPAIRQKRLVDQWRKHRQHKKKAHQMKRRLRRPRQAFMGDQIAQFGLGQPSVPAFNQPANNGFIPQNGNVQPPSFGAPGPTIGNPNNFLRENSQMNQQSQFGPVLQSQFQGAAPQFPGTIPQFQNGSPQFTGPNPPFQRTAPQGPAAGPQPLAPQIQTGTQPPQNILEQLGSALIQIPGIFAPPAPQFPPATPQFGNPQFSAQTPQFGTSQSQVPYGPLNTQSPVDGSTSEKPLLVEIADWLTGAVKYAKENIPPPPRSGITNGPRGHKDAYGHAKSKYGGKDDYLAKDDGSDDSPVDGFVKRLFAPAIFGNSTPPEAWSSKHFAQQAVLSNITSALDNFLKNHGYSSKHNAPVANEIVPTWQIEFLEDVKHLVMETTQQAMLKAQQQQDALKQPQPRQTVKILSPRLLPLDADQEQYDAKLLSPDFLSFTNEGIAPLPQLLGATVGEQSKEAWLRFIMEASGANDMLGDQKLMEAIIHTKTGDTFQNDPAAFAHVFDQTFNKFEDAFQRLYKTFSMGQIDAMENKGYAFMSRDQIEQIYHSPDSPCAEQGKNCSLDFDLHKYEKMTDAERDEALMDFILEFANAEQQEHEPWTKPREEEQGKRRSKRTLLLTPVKFSPLIRMSAAVSMPIVLSPILFSPIILSPSLLGPVILSPAIFSPIILSPLVLGVLLLSPFVGNPVILSPLVLFPIILSPLVLNPFILTPYVLTPIILSPLVLSPSILNPNVLSPLILDPGVLSPIILGPHALSPIILSPQVLGALILSPGVLSPIIASPVALFAIILSPQVLG